MRDDSKAHVTKDIVERTSDRRGKDSKLACRVHSKCELLHHEQACTSGWCRGWSHFKQLLKADSPSNTDALSQLTAGEHF